MLELPEVHLLLVVGYQPLQYRQLASGGDQPWVLAVLLWHSHLEAVEGVGEEVEAAGNESCAMRTPSMYRTRDWL